MKTKLFFLIFFVLGTANYAQKPGLDYLDIFEISYVQDPQISPDGKNILYRKMKFDIMEDKNVGALWIYNIKSKTHYKLTQRDVSEYSGKWSPDSDKIVFLSPSKYGSELFVFWLRESKLARISQLENSPSNISISPDGKTVAFTMKVMQSAPSFGTMPKKPKGAKWAPAPRVTDRLKHEADGAGYLKPGFTHVFTCSITGENVSQVTIGNYDFRGPISWSPDQTNILITSNIKDDAAYDFRNSEIYKVDITTGQAEALTTNIGPDRNAVYSPDGESIAYLSYTDKSVAYQVTKLWVMDKNGENKRLVSTNLDRSVYNPIWQSNKTLTFGYDDQGDSKLAQIQKDGNNFKILVEDIGGTTLGRPYASGSYSISDKGSIAYTLSSYDRPARLAISQKGKTSILSDFNASFFENKSIGRVEEVRYNSKVDGLEIQGWVVYPPNYDQSKSYPLLVENHGGPILNYGPRFSLEMQLYASHGYIVFYPNARGSNSYGEKFGNYLYQNYPGEDYNDVIDGVDFLIEKGIAHEDQLFVTGGSAGGLMTAWMVGKSNRFEAAVVVKPVINWISKTLVADNYYGYANSRYEGQPWENPMHYWKFSPISIVDQVETPTMVMVGMNDLRTPPSEAKQFYHALKLRKVETVLVEIPEASHGIAARPSNLIRKVVTTLAWFEPYLKN